MVNIEDLREKNCIIFECITGSRAYGLDLPHSDTDIRGVFVMPKEKYFGMEYIPQVSNESNDIVFYELGRFIELLSKNNPNILEMLNVEETLVIYRDPIFDRIKSDMFLSKLCAETFVHYAASQIKKARGLNKKIVNPVEPERKTPLNFCFVTHEQGALPFINWLKTNGKKADQCGIINVPHIKELFALFYDESGKLGYKGLLSGSNANEVQMSSIPKGEKPIAYLHFSKDTYTQHCKQYKEYWEWVDNRNEERYNNTMSHNKNYDSKNMMHTFRLLDMAEDLLKDGKIVVKRPNREELLKIRSGDFDFNDLLDKAEAKIERLAELKNSSKLPDIPNMKIIETLLVNMRMAFYK